MPPQGANQLQHQQSNLSMAPSNGADTLWGPLSKQSSSSSFWGGHQVEADPVPESVQVKPCLNILGGHQKRFE